MMQVLLRQTSHLVPCGKEEEAKGTLGKSKKLGKLSSCHHFCGCLLSNVALAKITRKVGARQ